MHWKRVGSMNTMNCFWREKDVKMYVENGIYDINNQPIKATFKYDKEGRLCLGVA